MQILLTTAQTQMVIDLIRSITNDIGCVDHDQDQLAELDAIGTYLECLMQPRPSFFERLKGEIGGQTIERLRDQIEVVPENDTHAVRTPLGAAAAFQDRTDADAYRTSLIMQLMRLPDKIEDDPKATQPDNFETFGVAYGMPYDPVKALHALENGVYDDPDLMAYGPLSANKSVDLAVLRHATFSRIISSYFKEFFRAPLLTILRGRHIRPL